MTPVTPTTTAEHSKLDQYNPKPFHDQYEQICKIPEL